VFNANSDFVLHSISVRTANGDGGCNSSPTNATFTLLLGATTLNTKTVSLNCGGGVGQTVVLDFYIPANSGYTLQSDMRFYFVGTSEVSTYPWRANAAVTYVSTTDGIGGPFADWQIIVPSACSSKQINVDCALPVSFISFNATKQNKESLLSWNTALEQNNKLFFIERSADGIHFETIGSQEGQGTTGTLQNYSFIDYNPSPGINYYRLRQVDFDGYASYSHLVKVVFDDSFDVMVYPNPSQGVFQISIAKAETIQAEVYNALGQVIWIGKEISGTDFTVDLSDQSDGVYFLQLINGQQSYTFKLIKK
jgi:hypothetical protein